MERVHKQLVFLSGLPRSGSTGTEVSTGSGSDI